MEVENGGLEDDFGLLLGAIFHFHDYGRKSSDVDLHPCDLRKSLNPVNRWTAGEAPLVLMDFV